MKNLNWVRRSVLAMICTVTVLTVIGYLIDPDLVSYASENPQLLSKQRNFAALTAILGLIVASLFYRNK
jgi:hypothetical protein